MATSMFGNNSGLMSGTPQTQLVAGPDLEEIQTDEVGFLSLAGDFKIRLLPSPWPTDALPKPTSSLMSVAPRAGILAAADPNALIIAKSEDVRAAFSRDVPADNNIKPFEPQLKIQIPRVSHVVFSSDEKYLVICSESGGGLQTYDVQSLLAGKTEFANQLGTENIPIRAVVPNPVPENGHVLAIVLADGKLMLANLQSNSWQSTPNGPFLRANGVSCVSWSAKGKQLVAGLEDGSALQLKPDGQVAAKIPKPPQLTAGAHVSSLLWLDNNSFLIVYNPNEFEADRPPDSAFFLVSREDKTEKYAFQRMGDPCPPFGMNRSPPYQYIARLRNFEPGLKDSLFLTSTAAEDVGLVTNSAKSLSPDSQSAVNVYTNTSMANDTRRAQLPMGEDASSTSPLALILDLSAKEPVKRPIPNEESIDVSPTPLPAVMVLNNAGVLSAWWYVYNDSIRQSKIYQGLATAANVQSTPVAQPVQNAFAAAKSPTTPAFGAPAFGQTSLGNNASPWAAATPSNPMTQAGGPKFGQPSFGQPSFGQPAFGTPSSLGSPLSKPPNTGIFGSNTSTSGLQTDQSATKSSFVSFAGTSGASPFGNVTSNSSAASPFAKVATGGTSSSSPFASVPNKTEQSLFGTTASADKPSLSAFGGPDKGSSTGWSFSSMSNDTPKINQQPSFGSTMTIGSSSGSFGAASALGSARSPWGTPALSNNTSDGLNKNKPAAKEAQNDDADMSMDSTENLFDGQSMGGLNLTKSQPEKGQPEKEEAAKEASDAKSSQPGAKTPPIKQEPTEEPAALPPNPAPLPPDPAPLPPDPPSQVADSAPLPPDPAPLPPDPAPLPPDPIANQTTSDSKADSTPSKLPPTSSRAEAKAVQASPPSSPLSLPKSPTDAGKKAPSKDHDDSSSEFSPAGSEAVDLGASDVQSQSPSKAVSEGGEKETNAGTEAAKDMPPPPRPTQPSIFGSTPKAADSKGPSLFGGLSSQTDTTPQRPPSTSLFSPTPVKATPSTENFSFTPESVQAATAASSAGLAQSGLGRPPVMFVPPAKMQGSPRSPSPVREQTLPRQRIAVPRSPSRSSAASPSRPASATDLSKRMGASRSTTGGPMHPIPPHRLEQMPSPAPQPEIFAEDPELEQTKAELNAPLVATRELRGFQSKKEYAGTVTGNSTAAQIEKLKRDIDGMVDLLGINARNLKSFKKYHEEHGLESGREREHLEPEYADSWVLDELDSLDVVRKDLEAHLADNKLVHVKDTLYEIREFQRSTLRLRAQTPELTRRINASKGTDDSSSKKTEARLTTEQTAVLHDLREKFSTMQQKLSKAEEGAGLLRAKLAAAQANAEAGSQPSRVPTVEAVINTIAKMTRMAEQKRSDVDVLEAQMKKLRRTSNLRASIADSADLGLSQLSLTSSRASMRASQTPTRGNRGSERFETPPSSTSKAVARVNGSSPSYTVPDEDSSGDEIDFNESTVLAGDEQEVLRSSLRSSRGSRNGARKMRITVTAEEVEEYRLKQAKRNKVLGQLREKLVERGAQIVTATEQ